MGDRSRIAWEVGVAREEVGAHAGSAGAVAAVLCRRFTSLLHSCVDRIRCVLGLAMGRTRASPHSKAPTELESVSPRDSLLDLDRADLFGRRPRDLPSRARGRAAPL